MLVLYSCCLWGFVRVTATRKDSQVSDCSHFNSTQYQITNILRAHLQNKSNPIKSLQYFECTRFLHGDRIEQISHRIQFVDDLFEPELVGCSNVINIYII